MKEEVRMKHTIQWATVGYHRRVAVQDRLCHASSYTDSTASLHS